MRQAAFATGFGRREWIVSLCLASLALLALCAGPAWAAAPEAPTAEVQSHTDTSAFLHGGLNPGAEPPQEGIYEFLYAASPTTCTGESKGARGLVLGVGGQEVGEEIGGLSPHTTYTVCLRHRNLSGEETLSLPQTFTTSFEPEAPETTAPSPIASSTAMLRGVLNPNASREEEPGAYEFIYKRSSSECEGEGAESTGQIAAEHGGVEKEAVEHEITGLLPGTQYAFCVRAWNSTGQVATGSPATFTTTIASPTISEEKLAKLGSSGATLTAQINPGGAQTTYSVQYGTSGAYGSETGPVIVSPSTQAVSVSLTGLQPDTAYHARFVATNEKGTEDGSGIAFTTYTVGASGLPDARALEMVTPAEDESADVYEAREGIWQSPWPVQAAADGDAVEYMSMPLAGGNGASTNEEEGDQLLAVRNSQGGWTQTNITPTGSNQVTHYVGFSDELSSGVLTTTAKAPFVPTNLLRDVIDTSDVYTALFATHFGEGLYRPLFDGKPPYRFDYYKNLSSEPGTPGRERLYGHYGLFGTDLAAGPAQGNPLYAGSSANAEDLLFEANDQLLDGEGPAALEAQLDAIVKKEMEGFTEEVKQNDEEYERIGRNFSAREEERETVVREFDNRNELYESHDGHLSLVNLLPDGEIAPGATFGGGTQAAPNFTHDISADGSRVFWTLETAIINGKVEQKDIVYVRVGGARTEQVSEGAAQFWTASANGAYAFYIEAGKLWRFDVESEERVELAGAAGGVVAVLGTNETGPPGSYLYFVSGEALPGENQAGQRPVPGAENLYVYGPDAATGGSQVAFIAALSGGEASNWSAVDGERVSSMSPDGRALTFSSSENLTGKPYPGEGEGEVYVYDAGDGSLLCASCRAQASGGHFPTDGNRVYSYRHISEDGDEVFFDSSAALVASDVNGAQDVYEWQRDGAGGCAEAAGCMFLLSGGVEGAAYLLDASVSGDDVFFAARQKLVAEDTTENSVLYDARVDGRLPVAPQQCTGTGCQGVPAVAPTFATPASVTFGGVGNFPPPARAVKAKQPTTKRCRRGSVDKHGRCVKQRKKQRRKNPKHKPRGGKLFTRARRSR